MLTLEIRKGKGRHWAYKSYEKHRLSFSASTTWHENGQRGSEAHWINGKLHRENRPAYTGWHVNGQKWREAYCVNGKFHRKNGPAYTFWYENGQKRSEVYPPKRS